MFSLFCTLRSISVSYVCVFFLLSNCPQKMHITPLSSVYLTLLLGTILRMITSPLFHSLFFLVKAGQII